MTITYLKKATRTAETGQTDVRAAVETLLARIDAGGEDAVRQLAAEMDRWTGPVVVTPDELAAAIARVPDTLKDDIRFAHANIARFARAQRGTISDCEIEVIPGLLAGQKQIPVASAGCYVPGGRYSHIASAIMTITTAKEAGVAHITACSPPRPGQGIPPAILFAMHLCGADAILNLGGVQGIAAMAKGMFGLPKADILVGPGNQYVAEAKRILFGEIGIDMFAGPTDSMVIADASADPLLVAWDLVGQAEHGYNSPVWLVTTDRGAGAEGAGAGARPDRRVARAEPRNARAAWDNLAEVILCDTGKPNGAGRRPLRAGTPARPGPDLDWWLGRLRCLRLAVPGRGDDRGLRRQDLGAEPRSAHLGRRALYRGAFGPQVHEDGDLAARHPRRRAPAGRGHRPDLAAGGDGGARPHGRHPAGEVLPR
jgi:sulfopropanediol 3-dehydrogenase